MPCYIMCTSSAWSNRVQNVVNIYWSKRTNAFLRRFFFCLTRIYSIVNPEIVRKYVWCSEKFVVKKYKGERMCVFDCWYADGLMWNRRKTQTFLRFLKIDLTQLLISAICIIKDMNKLFSFLVYLFFFVLKNRFPFNHHHHQNNDNILYIESHTRKNTKIVFP